MSHHFPAGYTGFIRGSQHYAGCTYGELTRTTDESDFTKQESARALPVPASRNLSPERAAPSNKVPGYTGFVAGQRDCFANTYGSTTRALAEGS